MRRLALSAAKPNERMERPRYGLNLRSLGFVALLLNPTYGHGSAFATHCSLRRHKLAAKSALSALGEGASAFRLA
ncbi:hypothetical protein D9M68_405560 [compost metagenome]